MTITKADIVDADIIDADELASDGTSVYLTLSVTSTTSGTKTVVVALGTDGEGVTGLDHPAQAGDKVTISGTSGGAGDGTFTIATVVDQQTFTVVESIGTSTGGTANFKYIAGALNVGFDPTGQTVTAATNVQKAITDIANAMGGSDLFLDAEPTTPNNTYSLTKTNGKVTQEKWVRTSDSSNLKTIDYAYTGNQVTQEVRKVYAADGTTIIAQMTVNYTYTGNQLTGETVTRDI